MEDEHLSMKALLGLQNDPSKNPNAETSGFSVAEHIHYIY